MSTNFREIARQKASKYGLLPEVFERQIGAESGFNPKALSPAGAIGIAQIMPATARGWGVNPADPIAALDASAKNMAGYVKTFLGGKAPAQEVDPAKLRVAYEKALRAYNAGPAAVEASKKYDETNRYVQKIIGPDSFSFTDALKNTQPAPQQPQDVAAAPGGRTFILFGGMPPQVDPKENLDRFILKTILDPGTPKIDTGLNSLALLTKAFGLDQAPQY
jgi:hypothetical protein